jgi:dihydrolipoamide dehydrogenase
LLGGHVLGAHAAELIGPITLAVQLRATARQLTQTVFAHPTLNEAILEAAEALFGQPTHVISRR